MADAVTQTEEKIEIETKTQACLGLNNPDLEKFVEHRFGKTIHNEEGYLWGKRNQGWATFRSEFCTGVARSYKANRCDDCHKLHSAMNLARSRKSESSEAHKFVPFSSLRVSPYVKELLERFKKENKGTTPKHVAREDDLEIDVSPLKFEILKYCELILFSSRTPRTTIIWCRCASRPWRRTKTPGTPSLVN